MFEHRTEAPRTVMSPEASYLISSILSDEQARAPLYGSSMNISGRQVAVKTGTTNDNKDGWTIGYTPSVVTGVWVGNNENEPMRGLAGGSSAGRIWRDTMSTYLVDTPKETFARPAGIVEQQACSADKSGTYREFFIRGTEPAEECERPPEPKEHPRQPEEDEPEQPDEPEQIEQEETEEPGVGGRGSDEPTVTEEEPAPQPTEPTTTEEPAPVTTNSTPRNRQGNDQ